MKIPFYQVLGVCILLFADVALSESIKAKKCPDFTSGAVQNTWMLNSSALSCRSYCESDTDCLVTQDSCGRKLFANKVYLTEIETFLKQGSYSCQNHLEVASDVKSVCQKKRCAPAYKSCEAETKKQSNYIAAKVDTSCNTDADCTFFLAPNSKCARRFPSSKTFNITRSELDLGYLRDAVLNSCKDTKIKECDASEKAYCLSKECLVFKERPPFKNFVNLEGLQYKANFQSNTTPLKMPPASSSKCQKDSDCIEVVGVCGQYIVSLNTKFETSFKSEIQKAGANIACPVAGKIEIPKSRCFKEFCSFVN